jgi:hypothetical protein
LSFYLGGGSVFFVVAVVTIRRSFYRIRGLSKKTEGGLEVQFASASYLSITLSRDYYYFPEIVGSGGKGIGIEGDPLRLGLVYF